jgi:hypothetical protein
MKRIFVPTESGSDWQRFLAKPTLHWKPGRSAMTLAAAWEATADRFPPEVASTLDASGDERLSGLRLLAAIPEYQVDLPGGDTASQPDVLALATNASGLAVLAVEGKVDEEFGPTLGAKRAHASPGQSDRLTFLHQTLGLSQPLPDEIRYQLLHRTVSAILVARDFHATTAVMLVHSFSEDNRWFEDYARFCAALGAKAAVGRAVAISGKTSPALFLAWCQGDQQFLQKNLRIKR